MRNYSVALILITFALHTTSALSETYCMWTVNDPKGKMNESFMKGQCERKEVKGAKNYTEDYEVQGRKFRIEYLGQSNGLKQKVKINGKVGTATEDNRYAKSMNTDDLTIDFSYDEALPDKSLSLSKIEGVWSTEPKTECKTDKGGSYSPGIVVIKGNKLIRNGGESFCEIYSLGKATNVDISFVLAKCQNEDISDKEMFSYSLYNNNKELMWNGSQGYRRCPVRR